MNKLDTRIREYRVKKDLTQKELAEAVDVRRETIVYLEKGKYNPSLKLSHQVAKTLDAEIDDLFIFEDEDDKIKKKQNEMEGEK